MNNYSTSKPNIHNIVSPYILVNNMKAKRQSQIAAKVSFQAANYASMIAYFAINLVSNLKL